MSENETSFDSLMSLAVKQCMEEEIAAFAALDASEQTVSRKTRRRVLETSHGRPPHSSLRSRLHRRVSVACLAAVTALLVVVIGVQPIRAELWRAMVTFYDEYLTIALPRDERVELPHIMEERILPSGLPEGWRMEVFSEGQFGCVYEIFGTNEEYIVYDQSVITDSPIAYNSENCVVEKINITDDVWGYVITYSYGDIVVHWEGLYEFSLLGRNVSREQLISIAIDIL